MSERKKNYGDTPIGATDLGAELICKVLGRINVKDESLQYILGGFRIAKVELPDLIRAMNKTLDSLWDVLKDLEIQQRECFRDAMLGYTLRCRETKMKSASLRKIAIGDANYTKCRNFTQDYWNLYRLAISLDDRLWNFSHIIQNAVEANVVRVININSP